MNRWLASLNMAVLTLIAVPLVASADASNGAGNGTNSGETPKAPASVKLLESSKRTHLYTQFDGGEVETQLTCSFYSSGWMQVEKSVVLSYGAAFGTTLGLPVIYPKYTGLNEQDIKDVQDQITQAAQAEPVVEKQDVKTSVVSHALTVFPAGEKEPGVALIMQVGTTKEVRASEATDKLSKLVDNYCFWYLY